MTKLAGDSIIRAIRSVVAVELTDRELLEHFVKECDESVFESLVRRHGGMVGDAKVPRRLILLLAAVRHDQLRQIARNRAHE